MVFVVSEKASKGAGPQPARPLFETLDVTALDTPDTPLALNVADEVPVRLVFNSIFPHGTMMLTPDDLEDFAFGYCLTEQIVDSAEQIRDVTIADEGDGLALHITITGERLALLLRRRPRAQTGHSSCGLCGSDEVPAPDAVGCAPFAWDGTITADAVRNALQALEACQTLNAATHMVHGAAWADPQGRIVLTREDVGRHNALDKLIGARMRGGLLLSGGICVLTSRYSFEMALKTVRAGMNTVVAVSAPTGRALKLAERMNQTVIAIARPHRQFVFCGARRLVGR